MVAQRGRILRQGSVLGLSFRQLAELRWASQQLHKSCQTQNLGVPCRGTILYKGLQAVKRGHEARGRELAWRGSVDYRSVQVDMDRL